MTKKILFIGRDCHIKTASDVFIHEILREVGDLTVLRREYMDKQECIRQVQHQAPDLVVYFQLRPFWGNLMLPLRGTKKVWIPMWDGFRPLDWKRCLGHKLFGMHAVSFCQKVHDHFEQYGLPSLRVTYFPEPNLTQPSSKEKPPYTVFLWQRDQTIGLDVVSRLFEPGTVDKVIFKSDIPVSSIEGFPFKVEKLEGWIPKDQLLRKVQEADYYLAPRLIEGIGFSFLEAMAMGKIVIGYDQATMNEYICDGVTGHLFNHKGRLRAHWPSPAEMQASLAEYCIQAHATWLKDRQRLKTFFSG